MAIVTAFGCYIFEMFRDEAKIIIWLYIVFHWLSTDFEIDDVYVKLWFCGLVRSLFCGFLRQLHELWDSSVWQSKVCAVFCTGSVERERQTNGVLHSEYLRKNQVSRT